MRCLLLALTCLASFPSLAGEYSTGIVDPRIAAVPAELHERVIADPSHLTDLVDHLLEGEDDPVGQVKLLHDWIATHIAYDLPALHGGGGGGGWAETLRSGTAVCNGYARLFARMCDLAGIEARVVSGHARGVGFSPLAPLETAEGTHAWNAVRIDDRWYLVDTTWDAGFVQGDAWVRRYGTDYLFAEPEHFIHSHLPADARWQLLDEPVTAEQFHDLPDLSGAFFAHGLRLESPARRLDDVGRRASLQFHVPPDAQVIAHLEDADGAVLEQRTFDSWDGDRLTIDAAFPESGQYVLALYARRPGEATYGEVASFGYEATVAADRGAFPLTYGAFDERRCRLLQPTRLVRTRRGRTLFRIQVPEAEAVSLVIGDELPRWVRLAQRGEDVFSGKARIPPGKRVAICARFADGDGDWYTLVEF